MKKPSFQFYPGDWRKDQNLSRASLQAKGALIEILCLAFECEKRGVLRTGKAAWSVDEIAHAMGGDKTVNISAIEELLRLKVLKKDKKNTIFSSRMVRDEAILKKRRRGGELGAEHGFKGKEFGKLGGRPVKKPPSNPPPSSSSSSSIESNTARAHEAGNQNGRKPVVPTIDKVLEVFSRNGGAPEMARKFFATYEATGWYKNGSAITNFATMVPSYINAWNENRKKDTTETNSAAPLNKLG